MEPTRKRQSADFNAKVALEAIRGEALDLARKCEIDRPHPAGDLRLLRIRPIGYRQRQLVGLFASLPDP